MDDETLSLEAADRRSEESADRRSEPKADNEDEIQEDVGPEEAPEAGTPDEAAQPQFLSLAEFRAWQQEYDAQQQARLQEVLRLAQAKSDKARETAIRKANAFEHEYVAKMKEAGIELTPEQIQAVKQNVINAEFWSPNNATDAAQFYAQQMAAMYAPQHVQPQGDGRRLVSRAELAAYVRSQGLAENEVNLDRYAGLYNDTPGAREAFLADVQAAKNRRAQNSEAGRVVQQFGGTATPSGRSGKPYDAEKEMERLHAQDPSTYPGGVREYEKRMEQLESELVSSGKWK